MIKNRHTIRLQGYDYSQSGYYFVTICTHDREWLFGEIVNGQMELNQTGQIVNQILQSLSNRFDIKLDQFQIMPNHVHAIIVIVGAQFIAPHNNVVATFQGVINHAPTLGDVVRYFKAQTAYLSKIKLWQRNYHEHIIRNDRELWAIRQYIKNNPKNWEQDTENL